MTYTEQAKFVEAALAKNGGDLAEALRELTLERCGATRRGKSKISPEQLAEMHRRRRAGAKLLALACDFQISEAYAGFLCTGIRPERSAA